MPSSVWAPQLPSWAARHTDQHAYAGGYNPPEPVLVAEYAQLAGQHAGPCAVCQYAMLAGDRVARLVDGTGRWVHVAGCSAAPRAEQARRAVNADPVSRARA